MEGMWREGGGCVEEEGGEWIGVDGCVRVCEGV